MINEREGEGERDKERERNRDKERGIERQKERQRKCERATNGDGRTRGIERFTLFTGAGRVSELD